MREVAVIELRGPVRTVTGCELIRKVLRTASPLECVRRGRTDRNMIRVAIGAVGPEGDDDIRPERAYDLHNRAGQFVLIGILECPVPVVKHPCIANAELLARGIEFALTHLAERTTRRRQWVADLASLATGRRDHHYLPASRHVFRQRPARTEGLVVGMREDPQQSRLPMLFHAVLHISTPSFHTQAASHSGARRRHILMKRFSQLPLSRLDM